MTIRRSGIFRGLTGTLVGILLIGAGIVFLSVHSLDGEAALQAEVPAQKDAYPASDGPKPVATSSPISAAAATPANGADGLPPLSGADFQRAGELLEFNNSALRQLATGYYALPDNMRKYAQFYLETWHLPGKLKITSRKDANSRLTPPKGIFDASEERDLARALADMDKALTDMLGHYRALEKYVADDTIQDDGRQGKALAKKVNNGHAVFMRARKSWLDIVENRAARAEMALLREHPLQRQILAARQIFSQIGQISGLMKGESVDRAILQQLRQGLAKNFEMGSRPPFPAAPGLERYYRGFLKSVDAYLAVFDRAMLEGFFPPQKRELVLAARNCQSAYNAFVNAANGGGQPG